MHDVRKVAVSLQVNSIIFDVDGTLVDSQESILEGFSHALAHQRIESKVPLSKEIVGPPLVDTLQKISGLIDPIKIADMVQSFVSHYDNVGYLKSIAYDGIDTLLRELKNSGMSLYVVTNKRHVPTLKILEHFRWTKFFEAVYAIDSSSVGRFKNKTDTLANLLLDFDIDPNGAVYVGDRLEDSEAARINGMDAILVSWGYGAESDLNLSSTQIVNSTKALSEILRGVRQ